MTDPTIKISKYILPALLIMALSLSTAANQAQAKQETAAPQTKSKLPVLTTPAAKPTAKASSQAAQAPPQVVPQVKPNGWTSYQTSGLLGDQDLYATASGIKIIERRSGSGITASAPDWTVYVFDKTTKRICSYKLKDYPGLGDKVTALTGGHKMGSLPLKPVGKTTLNGINAIECQTTKSFTSKQEKDHERESADHRFVRSARLLVADKVTLPKQALAIACKFYGVPPYPALPLEFKYLNLKGDLVTILLTSELKPIKLEAADFKPPEGFQKVASVEKLDDKKLPTEVPKRKVIETIKRR